MSVNYNRDTIKCFNFKKCIILIFIIAVYIFASASDGTMWDICSIIMIAYSGIIIARKKMLKLTRIAVWLVAISILFFLSSIFSGFFNSDFAGIINEFRLIIYCFFFLVIVAENKENIKFALGAFYIAAVILAIQMLLDADWTYILATSTKYSNTLRVVLNENQHVNITAYNLFIGFMAGILLFNFEKNSEIFHKKKIAKVAFWIGIIIIGIAVLASGSRKVLLGMGVIVIALFWDKKRAWKIAFAVVIMAIGWYLIFNVPVLYQVIGNRVEGIFADTADASTAERISLMKKAMEVYSNNIFFGVGFDQFKNYNFQHRYAHNNYLEILADFGTVGFCVYYSLIAYIVSRIRQNISKYRDRVILYGSVLGFLVIDFFQVSYSLITSLIFLGVLSLLVQYNAIES